MSTTERRATTEHAPRAEDTVCRNRRRSSSVTPGNQSTGAGTARGGQRPTEQPPTGAPTQGGATDAGRTARDAAAPTSRQRSGPGRRGRRRPASGPAAPGPPPPRTPQTNPTARRAPTLCRCQRDHRRLAIASHTHTGCALPARTPPPTRTAAAQRPWAPIPPLRRARRRTALATARARPPPLPLPPATTGFTPDSCGSQPSP